MKLICLAFALISLLVFSVQGKDESGDLATLTAKFHSIINELGEDGVNSNAYEAETAALLKRLEKFQYPGAVHHNISLDWFSGSFAQGIALRITIVVSSFEGMYLNSGIGTFYAALSDFLVNHGHTVTILYTRTDEADANSKAFTRWQANYAKKGVSVVSLDPLPVHVTSARLTQKSYQVYQYLKAHQEDFDVVHFPDWEGPGYFSVLAKHQQLAFSTKTFIVGLHGPWRWVKQGNQNVGLTEPEDFETDWLERRSVELADFVITPSVDLPRWLTSQGWSIPDDNTPSYNRLSLMPFLPGKEVQMINQRQPNRFSSKIAVTELVFFGRLEARKGVVLLADALDLLASRRPELEAIKVTFLGRTTDINGVASSKYLSKRAEAGKWPFKVTFATHKDRKAALDYLKDEGRGRVAVIPSLVDNAPYTIYECLYSGIPFIASNLPSISALITPEDEEEVLFSIDAEALASKIESIIDGGLAPVQGLVSADSAVKAWESFYNMVAAQTQGKDDFSILTDAQPLVSVCVTHYNRPELLALALQSIKEQDYPMSSIEVVLVDDGSTDKDAIDYIDSLAEAFAQNNWQIIKTENKYLGAARNTAARAARGDYLIFLDDDNIARPNQISTYVNVAQATGADLVTAAHDVFRGNALPKDTYPDSNIVSRSVPLGPAVALGVFKNCFGDANFFIKKQVFAQTGGFTEERGVGQEDYEFLADAVLSGLLLEAIPEPLLYYRMHNKEEQMMFATDPVANQVRSARPYRNVMDDENTEESETLTLLARRHTLRYAQGTMAVLCNMSVTSIQPSGGLTVLTPAVITFFANTMDCAITDIRIGSYACSQIVQSSSNGTFSCLAPLLPFPGTYTITLRFAESSDPQKLDKTIDVKSNVSGSTVAAVMVKYLADLSLYNDTDDLFNLFAALSDISPDSINLVDDVLLQPGQYKRSVEATGVERHDVRFSVVSPDPDETATALALRMIATALANRRKFLLIGVTILDFNLIGGCDAYFHCSCTPSYSGTGCSETATCPNNCTGNGNCIDGPYSRVCNCMPGFTGKDCSVATCKDDCNSHGFCNLGKGMIPACTCNPGWEGSTCNDPKKCKNECSGKGTCVEGVCQCVLGYGGEDCSSAASYIHDDSNNHKKHDGDGVTIGMSIAAAVAGIALITIIVLALYLYRLKR